MRCKGSREDAAQAAPSLMDCLYGELDGAATPPRISWGALTMEEKPSLAGAHRLASPSASTKTWGETSSTTQNRHPRAYVFGYGNS